MSSPLESALALHQQGRVAEAETFYRQALKVDPNSADAHHLLGLLLHQVSKTDEGIQHLKKALQLDPQQAHFFYNLGNVFQEAGKLEEAENCYREAIARRSNYAEAWNNLAGLLCQDQRPTEALEAAQRAVSLSPSNPSALNNMANALQELGEHEEANKLYRCIFEINPENMNSLRNFAENLLKSGEIEEARQKYQELSRKQPANQDALIGLGLAAVQQNRYAEAIDSFQRVLSLDPKNLMALNNLAGVHRSLGNLHKAFEYFQLCLDIDPNQSLAQTNRAQVLSLLVPSEHFEELTDTDRINSWESLFQRECDAQTVVLDLRSNTGIFTFLAARSGAAKVLSYEPNPYLYGALKDTLCANAMEERVEILSSWQEVKERIRSEQPQILVNQLAQIEHFFGAGIWEMRDAVESLGEGLKIFPESLILKAALIEVPSLHRVHPVNEISGFQLQDFNRFQNSVGKKKIRLYQEDHHLLSESQPCLHLDTKNLPEAMLTSANEITTCFDIIRTGTLHAVVYWLDQQLTDGIQISFEPQQNQPSRYQAMQFLTESIPVNPGDKISLKIHYSDHGIFWEPIT
jgi:tetratricopeptide (TPR) repeat protein